MKMKIVEFFKDKKVQKEIVTGTVFFILLFFFTLLFGEIILNSLHKRLNAFFLGFAIGMGLMTISIMITELIYRIKRKNNAKYPEKYHSCNHPKRYRFIDIDGRERCSDCHKLIEE